MSKRRTILALRLRLVQHHVVDIEVGNVTHIKRHDVIVTYANVVVGDVPSAIRLRVVGRQELLDHLEDIAQLAGVQGCA